MGNVDNDPRGYQGERLGISPQACIVPLSDFAVGAPQANDGQGAVYLYHGGEREELGTSPSQEIHANQLTTSQFRGNGGSGRLRNFGSALSGRKTLCHSGYLLMRKA